MSPPERPQPNEDEFPPRGSEPLSLHLDKQKWNKHLVKILERRFLELAGYWEMAVRFTHPQGLVRIQSLSFRIERQAPFNCSGPL